MSQRKQPRAPKYRYKPNSPAKYDGVLKKAVYDPDGYEPSPWSSHWRDDMTNLGTGGHYVIWNMNKDRRGLLKQSIWALGRLDLLERPFIVALSGRNWLCPKEDMETGKKIARRLMEENIVMIHGGDKGTERSASKVVRGSMERKDYGHQIIVPIYGMLEFKARFGRVMAKAINDGRVLILSPFTVHQSWDENNFRIRNRVIAGLADAMIGVQLTDEGSCGDIARKMLAEEKPVFMTSAAGRAKYCIQDHEFFTKLGAEEFSLENLDYVIEKIKSIRSRRLDS